jgi:hypothetical protein
MSREGSGYLRTGYLHDDPVTVKDEVVDWTEEFEDFGFSYLT